MLEGEAGRTGSTCGIIVCIAPQSCIVTHESNGIDIITALILNDISPLCKYRMDLVLQLKVGRASGRRSGHRCASLRGSGRGLFCGTKWLLWW